MSWCAQTSERLTAQKHIRVIMTEYILHTVGRGFCRHGISGRSTPAESRTGVSKCVASTHWALLKPHHTAIGRPAWMWIKHINQFPRRWIHTIQMESKHNENVTEILKNKYTYSSLILFTLIGNCDWPDTTLIPLSVIVRRLPHVWRPKALRITLFKLVLF